MLPLVNGLDTEISNHIQHFLSETLGMYFLANISLCSPRLMVKLQQEEERLYLSSCTKRFTYHRWAPFSLHEKGLNFSFLKEVVQPGWDQFSLVASEPYLVERELTSVSEIQMFLLKSVDPGRQGYLFAAELSTCAPKRVQVFMCNLLYYCLLTIFKTQLEIAYSRSLGTQVEFYGVSLAATSVLKI